MSHTRTTPATHEPFWVEELQQLLPVKSQFVLTGNIWDQYESSTTGKTQYIFLHYKLSDILRPYGYEEFILYDPVERLRQMLPVGEADKATSVSEKDTWFSNMCETDSGNQDSNYLAADMSIIKKLLEQHDRRLALFVNHIPRLSNSTDQLDPAYRQFLLEMQELGRSAKPYPDPKLLYNLVFWIINREQELPNWFIAHNPRIRCLTIPIPDEAQRCRFLTSFVPDFPQESNAKAPSAEQSVQDAVALTGGMQTTDLVAIWNLACSLQIPMSQIEDTIRLYTIGVRESPWRQLTKKKIDQGVERINKRLKGQEHAKRLALDIVKRAVTGMSGNDTSGKGRPKGVLFLAGPTGVGKTELAKSLAEMLFGHESNMIRFDMSEFKAEHADERLLGAPPGYVGYDAGGELTNAIRQKPFSIVLFDEIEKANPKLFDKFLQLLDEGTLTSGRGERVYFGEAVIIFTSNLGIVGKNDKGERDLLVDPKGEAEDIRETVREAINDFFVKEIGRPELLNRIGDNIEVFDFINEGIAGEIFDLQFNSFLDIIQKHERVTIQIEPTAKEALKAAVIPDATMNGGRGIRNKMESCLVNPLARFLFEQPGFGREGIYSITSFSIMHGNPTIQVQKVGA